MGSLIFCLKLGLIRKECEGRPRRTTGATVAEGSFTLGLAGGNYALTGELQGAAAFLSAAQEASEEWREALGEACVMRLVRKVQKILDVFANASAAKLIPRKQAGYIRLGFVRKIVVGCLLWAAAEAQWDSMTVEELRSWCPDENGYLDAFPPLTVVQDLSLLIFHRADWGPFVSLFACLMSGLARGSAADAQATLALVGSPAFAERAATLASEQGHVVTPASVAEALRQRP